MPARRSYSRRAPTREPFDYVLVACEGKKTEPNYFSALKLACRIGANVDVVQPDGNDPLGIVRFAERELKRKGYDKAYCVFDRNGHSTFDEALRIVREFSAANPMRLFAIPSIPCFEVWILLHYVFSAAPFTAVGARSSCDNVLRALEGHVADYQKGRPGMYEFLATRLEVALGNAQRLETHNNSTGSSNPLTTIHHLVTYLRNLKK